MIIGVDRLDQAKGIEERFRGYERLLARRPDLQGRLFFLQVTPPPQGDVGGHREIRARLDTLSGHINGAFATAEWAPLRYVNRGYARETLADMYRAARVGFVTPLCDGMNLVAKEYVAAQDPDDPGVLILSHFAGAAAQLKQALLVNPHSPEEVADALERAIAMPRAERLARWRALMDNVESEDVNWWLQHFLYALDPPTLASPDCPGGENDLATAS